jgi:ATP-binding cassette, subfamily B, bacterial
MHVLSRVTTPLLTLFDREAWRYFYRCYRSRVGWLLCWSLVAALRSLLLVPNLIMIRAIFDTAIPDANQSLLLWLALGIVAVRLASSGLLVAMRQQIVRDIQGAVMEMREGLVAHLYRLSRGFYANADALQARIVQDTARVDQMSNALFSAIVPALFTSIVLVVVLFVLQWHLTLIACIAVPVVLLTTRYTGGVIQTRVKPFQEAFERFSKGIQFTLHYMALTQDQGAADLEAARRRSELRDLRARSVSMARGYLAGGQLNETVMNLVAMLVLLAGAFAIMRASLTLGEFIAFYTAAGMLAGQLGTLTGGLADVLSGNEALRKLSALQRDGDPHPYEGLAVLDFKGHLELKQVSFSYGPGPLLEEVDLAIRPGQTTLITGANGSGKTTLLHLITGFWRPDTGELRADEVSYDEIDMPAFRRQIGFVSQRPLIAPGSLIENICYGREGVSDVQMRAAARASGAADFIERLPEGYKTQVSAGGANFSGGERQKLAIARALVAHPALLILDEPTNHLDAEAVAVLLANLRDERPRMAILIISHDERVAAYADRIFRLVDGRLRPAEPPVLAIAAASSQGG